MQDATDIEDTIGMQDTIDMPSWPEGPFKNVLIIAPHAHPDDGFGIGDLVRGIEQRINCHTIINEKYRKPRSKTFYSCALVEPQNKKSEILDWTDVKTAENHLQYELIRPINKVLLKGGRTLVLWVYRITEEDTILNKNNGNQIWLDKFVASGSTEEQTMLNVTKKTNFIKAKHYEDKFKAIGKEKYDACVSMWNYYIFSAATQKEGGKTSNAFTELLGSNKEKPIITGDYGIDCDNDNHMYKWFMNNGFDIDSVDSLSLSLRRPGIRDTKENREATANTIAAALGELSGQEVLLREITTESIVDKAYKKLENILSCHMEEAIYDAGVYLIQEFYDNNYDLVRTKKPSKKTSLNQLIDRLQSSSQKLPSRSWLNNAVNLVLERKELEDKYGWVTVQTYGQLNLSHKILLLPVKDFARKEQLIKEIAEYGYSVRKLREVIMGTKEEKPKSLPNLIASPNMLFSGDYAYALEEGSIAELSLDAIKKSKNQTANKIQEIEDRIKKMNVKIEEQKGHVTNYQQLSQALEKAERDKLSNPVAN